MDTSTCSTMGTAERTRRPLSERIRCVVPHLAFVKTHANVVLDILRQHGTL